MKKLRYLQIQFDTEIKSYEIPAFRSAIIEKAGRGNLSFHNHLNDEKVMYGYPVIQYKVIHRQPAIICLDYGVDEIHHFFQNKKWDIDISGRTLELVVSDLKLRQFNMQVWEQTFEYKIMNWIALNQENHKIYSNFTDENEKRDFLQKILTGNIISFAKGIKWDVDKPLEVHILQIEKESKISFKGNKLLGLNINFQTNAFLPDYIGLGKGVSHGFGIVRQNKNSNK